MFELEFQNPELETTPPARKRCPRCEESLPLSEFGICRARKDGLNLYCKACIREKTAIVRAGVRQYKAARQRITAPTGRPTVDRPPRLRVLTRERFLKLQPHKRVLFVLTKLFPQPQTFEDLRHSCRVSRDELSDALARLVGIGLPVGTRNGTDPRVYFLKPRSEVEAQLKAEQGHEAARSQQSNSRQRRARTTRSEIGPALSFSTVNFLMPSRITGVTK
jgi:DNA-binding HxlR family transcriptional regulator